MIKKPELLSPAGDIERLKFAFAYGADGVYLGAEEYGMRAAPKNFTLEQLQQAVDIANSLGKKIYLTLNTVPTNEEVKSMPQFIKKVADIGVHAVIVADIGVLAMVKEAAPNMEVHLSTQAGVVNYVTANAAYKLGAKRVVLARELSFEDIITIRKNTPPELDIECFVHGAMCMSFSGRCLLSHYLTGRDANRGECAQPCRWEWQLSEKTRPGQSYDIGENDGGTYIMNANDLCMAPYMDMLVEAGISSLKIEGRAKSFYYVASVTAAYRRALDEYMAHPQNYLCPMGVLEELTKTSHRRYSTGFYFGAENATQTTDTSSYVRDWELIAVGEKCENGRLDCTQRGKFTLGEELEVLFPSGDTAKFTPSHMYDEKGEEITSTPHAMMKFSVDCPLEVPPMSILRKPAKE
ncbi:MAG: U32 family peptidase [Oscillospiraceae bacterium]